ncbi:hypothetical protein BDK51DRAFT_49870 [Blyttiomyces helicus]|uniref:Uncharacterized protein n=1 Tax=Blyttiomyces helicus TaxID=388810 RepID=A0A4P9WKH2_9FUNG|nr:hypothetical protein BDK51DRAFT_49870 [Blyttiomyces helicus]|eukprot:RKO91660.1 hypothetical protein BDK51DRAFT_49870 [Blyttiomyces helicus]
MSHQDFEFSKTRPKQASLRPSSPELIASAPEALGRHHLVNRLTPPAHSRSTTWSSLFPYTALYFDFLETQDFGGEKGLECGEIPEGRACSIWSAITEHGIAIAEKDHPIADLVASEMPSVGSREDLGGLSVAPFALMVHFRKQGNGEDELVERRGESGKAERSESREGVPLAALLYPLVPSPAAGGGCVGGTQGPATNGGSTYGASLSPLSFHPPPGPL